MTIDSEGDGLRMKIDGMKLVSSHIAVYYDIGEWTFESCTVDVPPGSACDDDELANDPLCAM